MDCSENAEMRALPEYMLMQWLEYSLSASRNCVMRGWPDNDPIASGATVGAMQARTMILFEGGVILGLTFSIHILA